jgi:uncharacterized protein (TIGR03083 family)
MTGVSEQLSGYVDVWWEAVNDFTALLEKVPADAWDTPTDLPGWDVHAVAAHTGHLESLLAGHDHDDVEIGDPPHVRGALGRFTEQGVVARRDRTPDELINEIRSGSTARHTALLADPPSDPAAPAPGVFGSIGWSTRTLLRNRPLDVWMHEQDVRRALSVPGGMDSPAARHSAGYLAESLGYVLAKRLRAEPGTTVLLEVEGQKAVAAGVTEEGRGQLLAETPASPTVALRTDRESFVVLAGGRCRPDAGRLEILGDKALGEQLVGHLAVTP